MLGASKAWICQLCLLLDAKASRTLRGFIDGLSYLFKWLFLDIWWGIDIDSIFNLISHIDTEGASVVFHFCEIVYVLLLMFWILLLFIKPIVCKISLHYLRSRDKSNVLTAGCSTALRGKIIRASRVSDIQWSRADILSNIPQFFCLVTACICTQ